MTGLSTRALDLPGRSASDRARDCLRSVEVADGGGRMTASGFVALPFGLGGRQGHGRWPGGRAGIRW